MSTTTATTDTSINGKTYTIRVDEGHVFIRRDGDYIGRGEIRHTAEGVRFDGDALPSDAAQAIDDALSALTPRPSERDPAERAREEQLSAHLHALAVAGAARVDVPRALSMR